VYAKIINEPNGIFVILHLLRSIPHQQVKWKSILTVSKNSVNLLK